MCRPVCSVSVSLFILVIFLSRFHPTLFCDPRRLYHTLSLKKKSKHREFCRNFSCILQHHCPRAKALPATSDEPPGVWYHVHASNFRFRAPIRKLLLWLCVRVCVCMCGWRRGLYRWAVSLPLSLSLAVIDGTCTGAYSAMELYECYGIFYWCKCVGFYTNGEAYTRVCLFAFLKCVCLFNCYVHWQYLISLLLCYVLDVLFLSFSVLGVFFFLFQAARMETVSKKRVALTVEVAEHVRWSWVYILFRFDAVL